MDLTLKIVEARPKEAVGCVVRLPLQHLSLSSFGDLMGELANIDGFTSGDGCLDNQDPGAHLFNLPSPAELKGIYGSENTTLGVNRRISLRCNAFTIDCGGGTFVEIAAQGAIPGGQWVHYVGTWDGTTMRVYWDGVEKGSAGQTCTLPAATGNFLGKQGVASWYFDGLIDQVRLYGRGLTGQEVSDLYNEYKESYNYDAIGNITSKEGLAYSYGSSKPHAVTLAGSGSDAYDASGDMTTRGADTLTWNVERPMTANTAAAASYVYDGDGERVKKTEGGETSVFINRYYQKNVTTDEVTKYYYLGGRMVAVKEGTTLRYTHQDHLGSSTVSTNASGDQVAGLRYFPYGGTRVSSGNLGTDRKFTGQRLDGTGLYFYNARYYDAALGRFVSADTVVASRTNPQDLNRYAYVRNNPVNHTDPTGRFCFDCVIDFIELVIGAYEVS